MRVVMIEVGHWHAARHLRSLQLAGATIVGVSRKIGVSRISAMIIITSATASAPITMLAR